MRHILVLLCKGHFVYRAITAHCCLNVVILSQLNLSQTLEAAFYLLQINCNTVSDLVVSLKAISMLIAKILASMLCFLNTQADLT